MGGESSDEDSEPNQESSQHAPSSSEVYLYSNQIMKKEKVDAKALLSSIQSPEFQGDRLLAKQFSATYIPIICESYHYSLARPIKKMTLDLIKRLFKIVPASLLEEISSIELFSSTTLPAIISEILSVSLSLEEPLESHVISLQMIQYAMEKCPTYFKDRFASLGIIEMIKEMTKIPFYESPLLISDSYKIDPRKPYLWCHWSIMRYKEESLFIWNQYFVMELNFLSNGWFKFGINSKIMLMYSSGHPEIENSPLNFLKMVKISRETINANVTSMSILTIPSSPELALGNWILKCPVEGTLNITNIQEPKQLTVFNEQNLEGFTFYSNQNKISTFYSTTQFEGMPLSFLSTKSRKLDTSDKIGAIAEKIIDIHFHGTSDFAREIALSLHTLATQINDICNRHNVAEDSEAEEVLKELYTSLNTLLNVFSTDSNLTAYEIHFSRVVDSLNLCLNECLDCSKKRMTDRTRVFLSVFSDSIISTASSAMKHSKNMTLLTKKLISVLEVIEKQPLYLFDNRETLTLANLQRKFYVELRRHHESHNLRDFTGKHFKVEPLVTIKQLEKFLYKRVTKMWYDRERSEYEYIKLAKLQPIEFNCKHDFDTNGILYWIGSNGRTSEYSDPYDAQLINITCSDGTCPASGFMSDFISRSYVPRKCHLGNKKDGWLVIDLGLWLIPKCYTLRHAAGFENSALRNWRLEMSKDGLKWDILKDHQNDISLCDLGTTHTWELYLPDAETGGWRFIRIKQTGQDSSKKSYYLCVSGFEIYGIVLGVAPKPKTYQQELLTTKKRQLIQQIVVPKLKAGVRVKNGLDFELELNSSVYGILTSNVNSDGWVEVKWDSGKSNSHRMGAENKYELLLEVFDTSDPSLPEINYTQVDSDEQASQNDILQKLIDIMADIGTNESEDNESSVDLNDTSRHDFPQGIELRAEYKSLLPPFDPRPGHYNIPAMQPLEVLAPDAVKPKPEQLFNLNPLFNKVDLSLKLTRIKVEDDLTIALDDPDKPIFHYMNQLFIACASKKIPKPWDASYEIIYKTFEHKILDKTQENNYAKEDSLSSDSKSETFKSFANILKLLAIIYSHTSTCKPSKGITYNVEEKVFYSKKISNKISIQIKDPLALASGSFPDWIRLVMHHYPFIIPFDCKLKFFKSCSFGTTRSIIWLQERHKEELERQRINLNSSSRRVEDHHDLRLGRHLIDKVTIPRNFTLGWANDVMNATGSRKALLEVQFINEEGTGSGPSLEFYALVAALLQRKDTGMWLSDDLLMTSSQVVIGGQSDEHYVHTSQGLFPLPYPPSCPTLSNVTKLFYFLGTFFAKALQDSRIVDIPLSNSFIKLMCQRKCNQCSQNLNILLPNEVIIFNFADEIAMLSQKVNNSKLQKSNTAKDIFNISENLGYEFSEPAWFDGILNDEDLKVSYPSHWIFISDLDQALKKRNKIMNDSSLNEVSKLNKIQDIRSSVDSQAINFIYNPPSQPGYSQHELTPNGYNIDVSLENARDYIILFKEFVFKNGIRKQLQAFKDGFDYVFPIEYLKCFDEQELRLVLCGEQVPSWTKEDLKNFTEAKNGYDDYSPAYLMFINVAANFTPSEKKTFIQFATGCSSLPPGGLANLNPRLCVVRKETTYDGVLPSVNTCFHYLKLPEYKSEEELKDCLLAACKEKGFHLN